MILLVECSMNLFVKHSGKQGNASRIILVVGLKQVSLVTFLVAVDVFTVLSCKNTATFENSHVRFQGTDAFPQNPRLSSSSVSWWTLQFQSYFDPFISPTSGFCKNTWDLLRGHLTMKVTSEWTRQLLTHFGYDTTVDIHQHPHSTSKITRPLWRGL